jgi:enoyl-CoA hydratase/carnithine racemase
VSAPSVLRVAADGPIRRWTLARPERRNALSQALVDALLDAAREAAADDACRAVVLDGDPPVFCAGSDVRELAEIDRTAVIEHERRWPRLRDALRDLDVPVVVAIRGAALGGGLFLALYADWRVAADDAVLAAPEVALGWLPPGGIEELVEAVGVHRARELVLSARRVDARTALASGLVDEIAAPDRLDAAALAAAQRLAAGPPGAVASVKRYFRERPALSGPERDERQHAIFVSDLDTPAAAESFDRFRAGLSARAEAHA